MKFYVTTDGENHCVGTNVSDEVEFALMCSKREGGSRVKLYEFDTKQGRQIWPKKQAKRRRKR